MSTYIVHDDFPDGAALAAFLAQIILIIEYQVHLAIEQFRLEEIPNDDSFLMLRTLASHFLRAPIKQPKRVEK